MRAVVVPRFGGPEVLAVSDLPEPHPGPGEVSVSVEFAGVNYTDVRNRMGHGLGVPPFVPGVEVSGTVREVGSGVTSLRPGQPVAAFTRGRGYAEVALAREIFTVPLPGSLAGRPEAAGILVTVPTVLMLLTQVARVRPDELVLLHSAAGGVGTVAGQLALRLGLRPFLGTAGDAGKAEYALRHGYAAVYGYADFDARAREMAPGGVDVILDPVGGELRARSFGLLAPFGRLVSYSNISAEPEVAPDAEWLRARCVGYLGFSGGQLSARAPRLQRPAMEQAVELVASGAIDLGVSAVFGIQEVADAHRVFEARAARGKLVLAL
jgi:NADPH:quinone reductase